MREDANRCDSLELRPTEPLRHLLRHIHAHLQGQQVSELCIPAPTLVFSCSCTSNLRHGGVMMRRCFAGLCRTHILVRASSRRARGKSALSATLHALVQMCRASYAALLSCDEGALCFGRSGDISACTVYVVNALAQAT